MKNIYSRRLSCNLESWRKELGRWRVFGNWWYAVDTLFKLRKLKSSCNSSQKLMISQKLLRQKPKRKHVSIKTMCIIYIGYIYIYYIYIYIHHYIWKREEYIQTSAWSAQCGGPPSLRIHNLHGHPDARLNLEKDLAMGMKPTIPWIVYFECFCSAVKKPSHELSILKANIGCSLGYLGALTPQPFDSNETATYVSAQPSWWDRAHRTICSSPPRRWSNSHHLEVCPNDAATGDGDLRIGVPFWLRVKDRSSIDCSKELGRPTMMETLKPWISSKQKWSTHTKGSGYNQPSWITDWHDFHLCLRFKNFLLSFKNKVMWASASDQDQKGWSAWCCPALAGSPGGRLLSRRF